MDLTVCFIVSGVNSFQLLASSAKPMIEGGIFILWLSTLFIIYNSILYIKAIANN